MPKYKAVYKDNLGEMPMIVDNDYELLTFTLAGLQFQGKEFSDMVLINRAHCLPEQIKRFTFIETPIYHGINPTQHTLCDCVFEVFIPQTLIELPSMKSTNVKLKLEYALGKPRPKPAISIEYERIKLSIMLDGKEIDAVADGVDTAFELLSSKIADKYKFKNCYGCMYSDYSPYGNGSFGAMQCFVKQKKAYLNIKTKNDYFDNLTTDFEIVQEIYKCRKYKIRTKGVGYRG
ncbi:MAG: hypothetical protein JJT94_10425 [Bernardetiaceae bacterium]|nr:hypothetical protein [Bernardetiaceae bacterium]